MPDLVKINLASGGLPKLLQEAAQKTGNLRPLMQNLSGILHDEVMENFKEQGRPDKWKPLAESTIRERERKGYWPGRILQRTGQLIRSIQQGHSENAAWASTNKVYAAVHQFGAEIEHAARQQVIHFKKFRSGPRKGKVRFSKARNATFAQKVLSGPYSTRIPARPYLVLTREGVNQAEKAVADYITGKP